MLIQQWRTQYPLKVLCRVLDVSSSAFYSWQRRPTSSHAEQDALLEQRVRVLHEASKGRYGAPRLQADLRAEGQPVSRKRISRLMRAAGLRAKGKRRFVRTTDSEHTCAVCPNVLNRKFAVQHVNMVWVSDLTFFPSKGVWFFLAFPFVLLSGGLLGSALGARCQRPCP